MSKEAIITDDAIVAEALAWYLRAEGGEMGVEDWESFTLWLESNPDHAAIYDRIVDADGELDSLPGAGFVRPANDDMDAAASASRRRTGLFAGITAIAAALIAAILLWPVQSEQLFNHYQTGSREIRTIAVADGIRVEMNGGTEIEVASNDGATVRLLDGEAAFFVETGRPSSLRVQVGEVTLVDNGTIFNVIRDGDWLRVGVAEGEVILNPDKEAISIPAGQTLRLREGGNSVEREASEASAILAWRDRQLVYDDTPAQIVAADLSRNLGTPIVFDQTVSQRTLTGVIQLTGPDSEIVGETAALLGARARRSDAGWIVSVR